MRFPCDQSIRETFVDSSLVPRREPRVFLAEPRNLWELMCYWKIETNPQIGRIDRDS